MSQSNIYLSFLGFLFSILSQSLGAQNPISDLSPEQYFDFWVGAWELTWENLDGTTSKGMNKIEKILDGNVIQEQFEITDGIGTGFKGMSISIYHAVEKTWKQTWVDNRGGHFNFFGGIEGDKRYFQTLVEEHDDSKQIVKRMIFKDISRHSILWEWQFSEDGGTTWSLRWRIQYNRIN